MKRVIRYLFCPALLMISHLALAQQPAMADGLRAEGKIYVVVAIIMIVMIGLLAYLFFLDRKISRLEKLIRDKRQTK